MTADTEEGALVPSGQAPTAKVAALAELITILAGLGYEFVTPTTGTLRWNRAQRRDCKRTLRDIFGWSLPFAPTDLPRPLLEAADAAGVVETAGDLLRSSVRISTVENQLFAHSAYPPNAADAVFLGPDSYRFSRFICQNAPPTGPGRVLDVGAGAGVGAILAARRFPEAKVTASDINSAALQLCLANAQAAGVAIETVLGADIPGEDSFDLITANPPFISGSGGRIYRDGGAMSGLEIPLRWAIAGSQRLARGGRMLLYTGSPVRQGRHELRRALESQLAGQSWELDFQEIDPDIFSGTLGAPGYEAVERIAAVGAIISRI